VIAASVAPRKLIHAHEFAWDQDRDPVWKRYQKVWGFYDATDSTGAVHGSGSVSGQPPEATHCTNVGPIHRKAIYPYLKKWFEIPPPEKEPNERRSAEELRCWTDEAVKELKPRPLHEVLRMMAEQDAKAARDELSKVEVSERAEATGHLQRKCFRVGEIGVRPGRFVFGTEKLPIGCGARWIFHPTAFYLPNAFLLQPPMSQRTNREPLVVCVCQEGPLRFVSERAEVLASLVLNGVSVLLAELRGTGSDRSGNGRDRTSGSSAYASSSLMIGRSMPSVKWNEARLCISLLSSEHQTDTERILLWGESFAKADGQDENIAVPGDLNQPRQAEPISATLVSSVALGRPEVKAVLARGGLVSYRSVLDSPFVHVPHDALPINVFRAGDLPDVWAALTPKPLRLEGLVDGTNRRVTGDKLQQALKPVSEAYKKGGLVVKEEYSSDAEIAKWIIEQLKK
jgi:hypothetical protein